MKGKNFKFRQQDYKAIQGMNEKEAGQFIKGLCGYAFDGVPFETKDAKIASAYAYAKVALDISEMNRENGRKGGMLIAERKKTSAISMPRDDGGLGVLGVILSLAEESEKYQAAK